MEDGLIVYIVLSTGTLESVWFTEDEAVDALDDIHDRVPTAFIAVRPVGLLQDTPESREARERLKMNKRLMEISTR